MHEKPADPLAPVCAPVELQEAVQAERIIVPPFGPQFAFPLLHSLQKAKAAS